MSKPSHHLYTFGYEGLDIQSFINRLLAVGIQTIVDVRALPLSRKKGFSKSAFREALAQFGIAYFHIPALGCPKEVRNRYKVDKDWGIYTQSFLAYIEKQEVTVRELAKLSKVTKACLVCFEADFSMCHRTYVARSARRLGGASVMHLTSQTVQSDYGLRSVA